MPAPNAQVLTGPELRTIFLGFDQMRDELLYSNVKGKNPFKDVRVREAFYKAIDIEAIKTRVMRGLVDAVGADDRAGAVRAARRTSRVRSSIRTAPRSCWPRPAIPNGFEVDDGLPERPLRQRRRDLPGGGRHARPHRHQGEPATPSPRRSISPRC